MARWKPRRRSSHIVGAIAIGVAGTVPLAVLGAGPAGAHDAAQHVSTCLKAHQPVVEKVTPTSATVTFEYHDDCWYPAKAWLEVRGNGDWYRVGEEKTKGTGDGWTKRSFDLNDLNSSVTYQTRSAVEYIGVAGTSSETWFEPRYEPARDVRLRALGDKGAGSLYFEFEAKLFPQRQGQELWPYGNNTVTIYTQVNGNAANPVTMDLAFCKRGICQWRTEMREFTPGDQLRFQVAVSNSTYAGSFPNTTVHTKWLDYTAGEGGERYVGPA